MIVTKNFKVQKSVTVNEVKRGQEESCQLLSSPILTEVSFVFQVGL